MSKPKIITLTGASGSGKSSLAKLLLMRNDFSLVTSTTTRSARMSDLPKEYEHISLETFAGLQEISSFIWTAEHGGNHYGTRYSYIDRALNSEKTSLMILIPEVLPTLLDYAPGAVMPFYIINPGEKTLRQRLLARGEPLESIDKRLPQSRLWDVQAGNSGIPFCFIDNKNGKLRDAFREINLYLNVDNL